MGILAVRDKYLTLLIIDIEALQLAGVGPYLSSAAISESVHDEGKSKINTSHLFVGEPLASFSAI